MGEFGDRAIGDQNVSVERIPTRPDPWMPFAEFALSFDGYAYRPDLRDWANGQAVQFRASGTLADRLSLRDLRALVFYEQRRYHHLDVAPSGGGLAYIDALLAAIRRRVSSAAADARDQKASATPEDE
jgi:hypothetical protein